MKPNSVIRISGSLLLYDNLSVDQVNTFANRDQATRSVPDANNTLLREGPPAPPTT